MYRATLGHQIARLAWISEEGHWRLCIDQNQMFDPRQLHGGHLGQIGKPLHHRQPGTTLQTRGEDFGQQLHARRRGNACGRQQRVFAQRLSAEHQHRPAATADGLGDRVNGGVVGRAWRGRRQRRASVCTFTPGHVGGQDQGSYLPGQAACGGNRFDCIPTQCFGT
jgi:hypothetical protein